MTHNLNEYDRCPKHQCPVVKIVAEAAPVCLLDWLAARAGERAVRDVANELKPPLLVLDNGFALPYRRAVAALSPEPLPVQVDLQLAGWWVSDVLHVRSPGGEETFTIELRPPQARGLTEEEMAELPFLLLQLDVDALLDFLVDEEARKYEP